VQRVKASVYIATSLDGYIARSDGDIEWLSAASSDGSPGRSGEDYGYRAFLDTVDALVMGRRTYEKVLTFDEWPYGDLPVVVLSRGEVDVPERIAGTVEAMSGPPEELVGRLAERGATHLYVDGGATIQGFLAAGLIQQLIITRIPILLGEGIPLFGPLERDIRLRHLETRAYPNGLVQSRYEVA
jgi:dihydrofolate reductase